MSLLKSALLAVPAAMLAVPAGAAPFDTYFSKPTKGHVCYARDYDSDEIGANPRQRIDGVRIGLGPTTQLGRKNTPAKFDLALALKRKGGKEWYKGVAYCSSKGNEFHCSLEADGGSFRLKGGGRHGLRLHTSGLTIEGSNDFIEIGATELGYLTNRVSTDLCRKSGATVR